MKKGISSILIILITFIICVFLIVIVYFITSSRTSNNVQNNINTNNVNNTLDENSNNNNDLSNLTIEQFLNATKNEGITVPKINSSDSVNLDELFDTNVLNYYFYTSEDISTRIN